MRQLRLYIAEILLNRAFSIMPDCEEKDHLARLLIVYGRLVQQELRKK